MQEALKLIEEERQRQITVEGWTPEHDDSHNKGDLALAAACYAANDNGTMFHGPRKIFDKKESPGWDEISFKDLWPWDKKWDKRGNGSTNVDRAISSRIRELTKAGALIVAEIERLQRKKDVS